MTAPQPPPLRKCVSTPTLRTLGMDLHTGPIGASLDTSTTSITNGMEVYVVLRNFQEFAGGVFTRLPVPLQSGIRDCGVCHYMTVFRQPDGSFVQFDFGPSAGGDIHVPRGPLARLLNKAPPHAHNHLPTGGGGGGGRRHAVQGKVRERKITSLPDSHLYVGRTHLSMDDIRSWNSVHAATSYELHRSDCRHYVNSLVQYTTGVERATASALHHQWANNRQAYGLAERVVRFGHFMTDVANWDKVRAMGHATTAVIMALMGQHTLAKIKSAPLLLSMQRRMVPAVPRAISQRPAVAVGATAVATYAASSTGQTPSAVRDTLALGSRVASGVQSAVRAVSTLAEHVGRSASLATQQTTSHAVALATGVAGAASRGAATIMMARPRRRITATATATAIPSTAPESITTPPTTNTSSIMKMNSSRHGSPLRAMFPGAFAKGKRAQQLALVASRR